LKLMKVSSRRFTLAALEASHAPNNAADDKSMVVAYFKRPDGAVERHHMPAIDYNAIMARSPLAGWSLTPPDDGAVIDKTHHTSKTQAEPPHVPRSNSQILGVKE
jgi:hypothetical protein